jgi:hypothetical protein
MPDRVRYLVIGEPDIVVRANKSENLLQFRFGSSFLNKTEGDKKASPEVKHGILTPLICA